MLEEIGTVVGIEENALLVETLQKSACGSCGAQKGCGQHTLGKILKTSSTIRVLLQGQSAASFRLQQRVKIGIPEQVVVNGALVAYLVPLLTLLIFAWLGFQWLPSDGFSTLCGLVGLVTGGAVVRWLALRHRDNHEIQPVLLEVLAPDSGIAGSSV
ncbi:MAG: SoxR reducing system RseC family protein [Porticoccaceae bacterium]|nr:SoxR reducing system RseC family protein [Porticoccaceae bacterium]